LGFDSHGAFLILATCGDKDSLAASPRLPFDSAKCHIKLGNMKIKLMLTTPILALFLFSNGVNASRDSSAEASASWDYLSSTRIKPCDYWRSNREGDYVCSGYPFTEEMTDHRSLERVIRQMQDEIDSLKNRVRQLENQH